MWRFSTGAQRARRFVPLCALLAATVLLLPACPGDSTNPNTQFDLAINKIGTVTGQTITYTIAVTNVGNMPTLTPLTITDVLGPAPAGTQITSAAGASCSPSGTTPFQCTVNSSIPVNGQVLITLVVTVPAGLSGPVTNCAKLPDDSNPINNESCVTHNVTAPTGTITIVKDAQPNDSTNFAFSTNVATIPGFSLDDDSDNTLSNQRVISGVAAGTYVFTEAQVPGWTLTAITCSPAAGTVVDLFARGVSIALAAGANVTCTFTNTQVPPPTGSITIIKDAQPNDSTNFTFTSNQAGIAPFPLDDDSDATLSNQRTFTNLPAGSYTFTENGVTGWTLSGISCTPGTGTSTSTATRTATITLTAGANVTCTFTNTQNPLPGSITIVKDAQPNDSTNFIFTSSIAALAPWPLDDDSDGTISNQRTLSNLAAGTYTFTETQVAGWTLSSIVCTPSAGTTGNVSSGVASVVLTPGANVTCTFTNTKVPPPTGSITIIKDAQPNDSTNFTFTSNLAGVAPFPLDDDSDGTLSNQRTFSNLAAGTYTFTETQVAGWAVSNIACSPSSGSTGNISTATATIVLAAGANVVCTFTNSQVGGTLTIIKDAQPDDPQDFHFTTSGAGLTDFDLDDDPGSATLPNSKTFTGLGTGPFTVTEAATSGWTLSGVNCVNNTVVAGQFTASATGLNVTLPAGADLTCTFVNTRATGSITIIKDAQPNDSTNFTFTSSVATIPGFTLDDDSDATLSNQRVLSNLPAGTYTFGEVAVAGWNLAGISCTPAAGTTVNANGSVTIVLAVGANVVCTFTNQKLPTTGTLTIIKDASPNDTANFEFSFSGATSSCCVPVWLDDDAGVVGGDNANSNTASWTLPAGVYEIQEAAVAGWSLSSLSCTPGSATIDQANRLATVTLAAGASVTCTYTNQKLPPPGSITIIKDAQPNDSTNFTFTSSVATIPGFTLDDDSDATLSNQRVLSNLPAGTYTFGEVAVAGWNLAGISCTPAAGTTVNANGSVTIVLAAGANVVCTFTNQKLPTTGTLTIIKDASPNDTANFEFSFSGATSSCCVPVWLDDDAGVAGGDNANSNTASWTLPAGVYEIQEAAVAGWSLSSLSCTPGSATIDQANRLATVTLAAGASVTCTYTNQKQTTGKLVIVKDASPNDTTNFQFGFFGATSGCCVPVWLDDDAGVAGADNTYSNSRTWTLAPGTYNFTEQAVSGWSLSSISCTPSAGSTTDMANRAASVTLAAGDSVTCTFTNQKLPTTGTITIVKDAQPNHAQDFSFSTNIATMPGFILDDDSDPTRSNQQVLTLPAGTYSFTETAVSGWALSGVSCTPSAGTSFSAMSGALSVNLAAGANITCTFTNTKLGTLTIIKDAQPNDPQDFHFVTTGAGLSDFDLDDDPGDSTLSNTRTFSGLANGVTYTVTESLVAGWTTPSIQCVVAIPGATLVSTDQANRTFSVTMAEGADVTCTVTNVK